MSQKKQKRLFQAFATLFFGMEHRCITDLHCRKVLEILNSQDGKRTISRRDLALQLWCNNDEQLTDVLESITKEYELVNCQHVERDIVALSVNWDQVEQVLGQRVPRRKRERPAWESQATALWKEYADRVEQLKQAPIAAAQEPPKAEPPTVEPEKKATAKKAPRKAKTKRDS